VKELLYSLIKLENENCLSKQRTSLCYFKVAIRR